MGKYCVIKTKCYPCAWKVVPIDRRHERNDINLFHRTEQGAWKMVDRMEELEDKSNA